MDKINNKWEDEKIQFDQEDYEAIHKGYWENFKHKTLSIELSSEETEKLIQNCKKNIVSVNSGILTAFIGAQNAILGSKAVDPKVGIGVDLRKRLDPAVGDGMGFYASAVNSKLKYKSKLSMWENAQAFQEHTTKLYINKNFFGDALNFENLDATIMESRHLKVLGKYVNHKNPRYNKLSSFSERNDTLLKLLKRSNSDSIDKTIIGTAITNLTKLDFQKQYGDLVLDRLIMQPGGAFPLTQVNLVVGAVTVSDKLSLLIEFAEDRINLESAKKIIDLALKNLIH